jgi:chromosome segregation ATPase
MSDWEIQQIPEYEDIVPDFETQEQTMENQITEQNMREYFERIVSHVVGLSEQARKVDELSQKVNDLSDRVTLLQDENIRLGDELQHQIDRANQVQAQADATQLELQNAREHSHALAETIIMRDSRVSELERQKEDAYNEAHEYKRNLEIAQNRVNDLEAHAADLRQLLERMTEDRDNWQRNAVEFQRQAQEFKVNFDRIQSILNPPRPVESYVSETSPVADVA